MTLRSLTKKPETILYPVEQPTPPEGLRGHIDVDMKDCILCGICQKRCPTGAISVNKEDGTWTINRFDCIQCQICVRECPHNCLTAEPGWTKPAAAKTSETFTKPEPTAEELAEKARKEAEKAERVKKALEAKKAREAAKAAEASSEAS